MLGGIISAAGQVASAIGGAIASSRANKKAQEELDQRKADNESWYNRKMASDYTSRADVQNSLTQQKELLQNSLKNARATNTVAGGTAESEAIAKKQATQATADATATIASGAANYKDNVENQYLQNKADLSSQQQQIYQNQAQVAANAASQTAGAFGSLGGAMEESGIETKLTKKWSGQ